MKRRVLMSAQLFLFLLGAMAPLLPAQERAAAPAGQKAGSVSALLPVANIERGTGRRLTTTAAKKGDAVVWDDVVKTEKAGRARITLDDGSILSVGAQSSLRIVRHDTRSQQTSLELAYGRVRAQVASITRGGGRFQMRTPTAVAGVIGTDFGINSSAGGASEFVCLSGVVEVGNADPNVPGTVQCTAGMYTSVSAGAPPTTPVPASPQQIQQVIEETEPAIISALSPGSVLVGTTVNAIATGTPLSNIASISVSGEGVTASLAPGGDNNTALMSIAVSPTAATGPRVLTLNKVSGTSAAAVFTVVGTPGTGETDPEKIRQSYLDIFESERQSAISGLNSVGVAVQQSADLAAQQLSQSNATLTTPIDLTEANNGLTGLTQSLIASMTAAGTSVNNSSANSVTQFQTAFNAAMAALIERTGGNVPDDAFRQQVLDSFNQINANLLSALQSAHAGLAQNAINTNNSILALVERYLQQIELARAAGGGVQVALSPTDRSVEQGADATFEARTQAGNVEWSLCSSSYNPTQVGVALPGNDNQCTPLTGFTVTGPVYTVNTCSLEPGNYAARVRASDGAAVTLMDARLSVVSPGYDDPRTRLQNLAFAYTALQPEQFMSFFDSIRFGGYTSLQENIRNTFNLLSTMSINLRISQSLINCNEATLRADWEQIYTFKNDPNSVVFSQTEQLTVRMLRDPGRGWFITELQGDNGTLQGLPPGPVVTDNAAPDLDVVEIFANPVGPGLKAPRQGAKGLSVPGGGSSNIFVPSGQTLVTAVIQNVGNAPLTITVPVDFELRTPDRSTVLASSRQFVPVPLEAQASTEVSATLSVPELEPGTEALLIVTLNPDRVPNEPDFVNNTDQLDAIINEPFANYTFTAAVFVGRESGATGVNAFQVGEPDVVVRLTLANVGNISPQGDIAILLGCTPTPECDPADLAAVVPAPAAGTSVELIIPAGEGTIDLAPGAYVGTATILTEIVEGNSQVDGSIDNSISINFEVFDFQVELPTPFTPVQNIRSGTTGTVNFVINEPGVVSPQNIPVTAALVPTSNGASLAPTAATLAPATPQAFNVSVFPPTPTADILLEVTGTNRGVTRFNSQLLRYYQAFLENVTDPLNSNTQPVEIVKGATQTTDVTLRLTGTFDPGGQPVTLSVVPVTGFTFTFDPVSLTGTFPQDFTLQITAGAGATTDLITSITVQAQIPNTNPVDVITLPVFIKAIELIDLEITDSVAPSNRVLLGEPFEMSVTITNNGPGTSPGNEPVRVESNGILLGLGAVPQPLGPGQSVTFNVHCVLEDTQSLASSPQVFVQVQPGRRDSNNNNDFDSTPATLATTDWFLFISGDTFPDGSFTGSGRLAVTAGGASATTRVHISDGVESTTSFDTAVELAAGGASNFITQLVAESFLSTSVTDSLITISAASGAADGDYFGQVIARFKDGARVTAERQATIFIAVGSGLNPDLSFSISSSRGHDNPDQPMQLNGPLVERFELTATRSGGTTGTIDLHFTDPIEVATTPSVLNAVPYTVPQQVSQAAVVQPGGFITTGTTSVTVSGTAIQTAIKAPGLSSPDPVNQIGSLSVRVGDLVTFGGTCVDLPPGSTSVPLTVDWGPVDGFDVPTLDWQWLGLTGTGITVNVASGSSTFSAGDYSNANFTFGNTNTANADSVTALLAVTVSNGNSTATKFFSYFFVLSNTPGCIFLQAPGGGNRGSWNENPVLAGTGSLAAPRTASSALPDVRISPADVSFSPSVPREGDTLEVRFRLTNSGDADATEIPVALQLNGRTVARDTFTVAAGRGTLAQLAWENVALPAVSAKAPMTRAAAAALTRRDDSGFAGLRLALVVDPDGAVKQKSAQAKSAIVALNRFAPGGGSSGGITPSAAYERLLVEIGDASCIGFRFSGGATANCDGADVAIVVEDLAEGRYRLTSDSGVTDLGLSALARSVERDALAAYGPQAVAVAGHSYAVQLGGGRSGHLTVNLIRSPRQLEVKSARTFNRSGAARTISSLGGDNAGPAQPGDTAGVVAREAYVYFEILYRTE